MSTPKNAPYKVAQREARSAWKYRARLLYDSSRTDSRGVRIPATRMSDGSYR